MGNPNGHLVHGKCHTRLHGVWSMMKQRCFNPNQRTFKWYGARGITVCPEWLDFMGFYEWAMANGYSEGLTLDRIDPNENYTPENCRWVSWKEQMCNKRSNRQICAFGKTLTVQEWSETTGIHRSTIVNRLKAGWTPEQAVTPGRRRCVHG